MAKLIDFTVFMAYRKFKADQIFTGTNLLKGREVLITTQQGVIEAIVPAAEAGEDVQEFEGNPRSRIRECALPPRAQSYEGKDTSRKRHGGLPHTGDEVQEPASGRSAGSHRQCGSVDVGERDRCSR